MQVDKKTGNSRKKQIAEMLTRAFHDDPMAHYVFPEAENRDDKLPNFYEIPLRYGLHYGEVYVTSLNLEGGAVWIPSEKEYMSMWRMILAGAFFNMMRMGSKAAERIGQLGACLDERHKLYTPERHW